MSLPAQHNGRGASPAAGSAVIAPCPDPTDPHRRIVRVNVGRVSATLRSATAGELDAVIRATVKPRARSLEHGSRWVVFSSALPGLLAHLRATGWRVIDDSRPTNQRQTTIDQLRDAWRATSDPSEQAAIEALAAHLGAA